MTRNNVDLRALADRPAPIAKLDSPWADSPTATDPVRKAAQDSALAAGRRYADLEAGKAAELIARIFPGAHRVVFSWEHDDDAEAVATLRAVWHADGRMLWHSTGNAAEHPDAVKRAREEAYGGPVMPTLDPDSRDAVEELLSLALDLGRGGFDVVDEAIAVKVLPDGKVDFREWYWREGGASLRELIVPEVLAKAKRLTGDGPAVTFNREAFRAWCASPAGGAGAIAAYLLTGEYDSSTDEASAVAERALGLLSDVGEVWAYGDGVSDVTIYRTTDGDGADGGGAVLFTIDGIEMSAGHLQGGDLVAHKVDDEGRVRASAVDAAEQALRAIAEAVNVAAARFRLVASRREAAAPAEQDDPTLVLWLTGELTRMARTGEQPVRTAEYIATFLAAAGLLVTPATADAPAALPQLREGEVWRPVTLGFDGLGGDTWHAVYDPFERWNGWLCPRFRREEAELMRLYFEAGAARNPEFTEMDTLRWDGDVLVMVSGQYNRDGGTLEPGQEPDEDRIEPDERGLYPIGVYNWCWSAARIDEPAAGGDAPASDGQKADAYEDFVTWRDGRECESLTIGDAARQFTGTPLGTLVQWWVRDRRENTAAGA